MANLIKTLPIIQSGFEECRVQEQRSGWMESNAREDMMKWISNREVVIQTLDVDGLGDYPVDCNCFPTGGFTVDNKTFKLGVDRSKKFCWRKGLDIDTEGVVTASNLLRVFRQRHVIPEIDAYRYSKLANYAIDAGNVTSGKTYVDPNTALADLRADVLNITKDGIYTNNDLIIIMEIGLRQGVLNLAGGGNCCNIDSSGNLKNFVNSVDGIVINEMYAQGFMTRYIYKDGFSGEFGFSADPTAKQINWIICPRTAPVAIVRYDDWKAFDPSTDDCADDWRLLYSMYHDLWVTDCDLPAIWVNHQ